jgi:hypothetical protein
MPRLMTRKNRIWVMIHLMLFGSSYLSATMVVMTVDGEINVVSGLTNQDSVIQRLGSSDNIPSVQFVGGKGVFLLGKSRHYIDQAMESEFGFEYLPIAAFDTYSSKGVEEQVMRFWILHYFSEYGRNYLLHKRIGKFSCGSNFCVSMGFHNDSLVVQDMRTTHRKLLQIYKHSTVGTFELEVFLNRFVVTYSNIYNFRGKENRILDIFDVQTESLLLRLELPLQFYVLNMASYGNSMYFLVAYNQDGMTETSAVIGINYRIIPIEYRIDASGWKCIRVSEFDKRIKKIF